MFAHYFKHLADMKITQLLKSRNQWRHKAVERNLSILRLSRQVERLKSQNAHLKDALQQAKRLVESPCPLIFPQQVRLVCVLMFFSGVIPCNGAVRLLQCLKSARLLSLSWVPDPSSVVNWICRSGLGLLRSVGPVKEPWIAIVDSSIAYGKAKALVVLRVPLSIMQLGRAPTLADVECIALEIRDSWVGENVHKTLSVTFAQSGPPLAILKDGGSDLAKGVSLLRQEMPKIKVIQDIGHVFANLLKKQYSQKSKFKKLLELVNLSRSRLCLTALSALKPPQIRCKGRFQSIINVLQWAKNMSDLIGGQGQATKGSVKANLREILKGLSAIRGFVDKLNNDCQTLNEIQHVLKNGGLNQSTYQKVLPLCEKLRQSQAIYQGVKSWLAKHIRSQCQLQIGQTPLLISSDIIECLMGAFKNILERCPNPEFTSLSLAVPLLCGELTQQRIESGLRNCPHKILATWRKDNCHHSQRHRKKKILKELKRNGVPETLRSTEKKEQLYTVLDPTL
jgi:hypothetical protein